MARNQHSQPPLLLPKPRTPQEKAVAAAVAEAVAKAQQAAEAARGEAVEAASAEARAAAVEETAGLLLDLMYLGTVRGAARPAAAAAGRCLVVPLRSSRAEAAAPRPVPARLRRCPR